MPEQNLSMQDEEGNTSKRLRRLQEHSRSNMPMMMANRSMSSFTLQEEPLSPEAQDQVLVVVYPQDPFIGEPEVRSMSRQDINPGLVNSRVRVQDSQGNQIAQPDADGNYLYWPDQPQFEQVNAFYYTTFTLRMHERYARRAIPWSFPTPRITVDPHIGDQANAFYNEQDRLLGFHTFQLDDEVYNTAHSADIISHEAAHAVLDGVRDLYNESFGLGPTAFHESFGDMTAMLVALHDDSLIRRLLEWTNGDLRMENFVAEVAEHLTKILQTATTRFTQRQTVYLRNAINNLVYKPFDVLKYTPANPQIELGLQGHNYSRLFTGAFYDIFAEIYEQMSHTMASQIAIYRARDTLGYLLMCAVDLGPVGEFDFSDMAKAFIAADQVLYDGHHADILKKVFAERGLLTEAQSDNWIGALNALPEIHLPEAINSAMASALFLEKEVLPVVDFNPQTDLIPMGAYRNAAGYAYLTYFTSRRLRLSGSQFKEFNGAHIDVFGGLTLMFDPSDRLRSVFYRPVASEDERQIKILTAELIQAGLIVNSIYPGMVYTRYTMPEGLFVNDGEDWEEVLPQEPENPVLVKYPVIFDPVPNDVSHFADYLRQWRSQIDKES